VTGEVPETSADRAWASYRRWASWIPVLTGGGFLWLVILLLAGLAFAASLRRRARHRRRWDEEERLEAAQERARRSDPAGAGTSAADPDERDERDPNGY
jgi:hypothetical protein